MAGPPRLCWPGRTVLARGDLGRHETYVRRPGTRRRGLRPDRDDLDLYGFHVAVGFAARIRGQARFDSAAELVAEARTSAMNPIAGGTDAPLGCPVLQRAQLET